MKLVQSIMTSILLATSISAPILHVPGPKAGELVEVGRAAYYSPGMFKVVAANRHIGMRWDIGRFCAVRWDHRDLIGRIVEASVGGGPRRPCHVLDVQNPAHPHGNTVIEVNYGWAAEAGFVAEGHAPAVIYLPGK